MFNTFQYNTKAYNTIHPNSVSVLLPGAIELDGFLIQSSSIRITGHDFQNAASRDIKTERVPRGDGRTITGDNVDVKTIKLWGTVIGSSAADLMDKIQNLKQKLAVQNASLDVNLEGQIRHYVVNWTNPESTFEKREHWMITRLKFMIEFSVFSGYGYAQNYTSNTLFVQTNLTLDDQMNNRGNANANPVVIIVFTSATDVTAVSFRNNTTGRAWKITENIEADDILKFDSETQEVYLNEAVIEYEGYPPQLLPEDNSVTLAITGSAATYDVTKKFKKTYR